MEVHEIYKLSKLNCDKEKFYFWWEKISEFFEINPAQLRLEDDLEMIDRNNRVSGRGPLDKFGDFVLKYLTKENIQNCPTLSDHRVISHLRILVNL